MRRPSGMLTGAQGCMRVRRAGGGWAGRRVCRGVVGWDAVHVGLSDGGTGAAQGAGQV